MSSERPTTQVVTGKTQEIESMTTHIPDEILMKQVLKHLAVTALSIHQLKGLLNRSSEELRQALKDLEHAGKVRQHWDGCLWELAHGGYCPDPGGEAA